MGKNQSKEEQHEEEEELTQDQIRERRIKRLESLAQNEEQEEDKNEDKLSGPEHSNTPESHKPQTELKKQLPQSPEKFHQGGIDSPSKISKEDNKIISQRDKEEQIRESPQKTQQSSKEVSNQNTENNSPSKANEEKVEEPIDKETILPISPEKTSKPKHPVYEKYGEEAYAIHSFFENIFQFTFYPQSLVRNPDLKLFKDKDHIEIFSIAKFDDIIQNVLESKQYFQSDEKLIFLHNISYKVQEKSLIFAGFSGLISELKISGEVK